MPQLRIDGGLGLVRLIMNMPHYTYGLRIDGGLGLVRLWPACGVA